MNDLNKDSKKRGFLQNDKFLVCSMLSFYSICIAGLITAAFFWMNQKRETAFANATATRAAKVTEQAFATTTAIARTTEQAQYLYIDRFDNNKLNWREGEEDSKYWSGSTEIAKGVYKWNVEETKDTFMSWADYPLRSYQRDFDVYVDTKILTTHPGDACSGFLFRVAPTDLDDGGYYFSLCNDATASVSYHTEQDGWETIEGLFYPGYTDDWNRLEIIARGTHCKFFINGELIYEMDDDRRVAGGLALAIELNEEVPATIWFDNFGFHPR
jgi:hypothetical protein